MDLFVFPNLTHRGFKTKTKNAQSYKKEYAKNTLVWTLLETLYFTGDVRQEFIFLVNFLKFLYCNSLAHL